jgi:hypothetical protein
MNDIVKPLTSDGMCGWDEHQQLWLWELEEGGGKVGRIIGDPRGQTCRMCRQGWILTCESLKDQRYDQDNREWWHYSCYVRYIATKDRDLFDSALIGAHIRFSGWKEIPSQYWRRDPVWSKRSWYVAEANDQPIKITIGSRKRVYNIEFEPTPGTGELLFWQEAGKEFASEKVTKEFIPTRVMLHAWGGDQLKDYMKCLSKAFSLDEWAKLPKAEKVVS